MRNNFLKLLKNLELIAKKAPIGMQLFKGHIIGIQVVSIAL
jgi:hypothetical protein